MNEHIDPLEAELAALKPRQPSPALRPRIAGRLEDERDRLRFLARRKPDGSKIGFAVAAALAAIVALALWMRPTPRPTVAQPTDTISPPPIAAAFDDALPTVWTYQRALFRSPRELEALLDRHAALSTPSNARAATQLFVRSDRHPLLQGEL